MSKFHINAKGDVLRCNAKIKCQFGLSLNEHYETRKEARDAYESRFNEELHSNVQSKKKVENYETPDGFKVIDPDDVYNSMDHKIDYTPKQAQETFNNTIKGKHFLLKTDRPEEPGILLEKLFGKLADSVSAADLGQVELKTIKKTRARNSVISLTQSAMENASQFKDSFTSNMDFNKIVKAGSWTRVGKHNYALLVDNKNKKLRVIVGNENKEIIDRGSSYWDFNQLNEKVDNKLKNIAVATYEVDEGTNTAVYDNINMGGFTQKGFIEAIEKGEVIVEFRKRRGRLATVFKSSLKNILK